MGGSDGDFAFHSRPIHKVTVRGFYMGRHPVTQSQWYSVMGRLYSLNEKPKEPIEMVSWREAIAYCNKRSVVEGLEPCYKTENGILNCYHMKNGYRLPTEAEWEFAARGGNLSCDFQYAGSDVLDEAGWYKRNSNGKAHEVGSKKENELGLHDMSGNVWEWCWDYFGYYSTEDQVDPTGPPAGKTRVYRGGSFTDFAYGCTVTIRGSRPENRGYSDIGFRIVRTCI